MLKLLLNIVIVLLFVACASVQSGKHVRLDKTYDPLQLASQYNVTLATLVQANLGKEFTEGEWIFIPFKSSPKKEKGRKIASISDDNQTGSEQIPALSLFSDKSFLWPVPKSQKVSSPFGIRRGKMHEGIDISGPIGLDILSIESGVVVYAAKKISGYGWMTVIAHEDGFFSVYGHAKKLLVRRGDKVERGQVIALLGNSGRSSGPHLHFEVRRHSEPINPLFFYRPEQYALR